MPRVWRLYVTALLDVSADRFEIIVFPRLWGVADFASKVCKHIKQQVLVETCGGVPLQVLMYSS